MYYAVVKNIEIIGKTAHHLTKSFCKQHPETEWDNIIKMRNVLVHDYYQIKVEPFGTLLNMIYPHCLNK